MSPAGHRLPDALLEGVAEQFRALSEPSRLRLMNLLATGERNVGELAEASGLSPANVSKHLLLLHRVGWIRRRRDGLNVVYALADRRSIELCALMCGRVRDLAEARVAAAMPGKRQSSVRR